MSPGVVVVYVCRNSAECRLSAKFVSRLSFSGNIVREPLGWWFLLGVCWCVSVPSFGIAVLFCVGCFLLLSSPLLASIEQHPDLYKRSLSLSGSVAAHMCLNLSALAVAMAILVLTSGMCSPSA